MAVICKKCGGQHPMWDCKATAAQIAAYKNRGGSSAVEPRPSKLGVEGSTPSLRSKKSRPVRTDQTAAQNTSTKQRFKPAAKARAGSRPRSAPAATKGSSAARKVIRGLKDALAHAKGDVTKAVEHKRGRGRPKTIVDMRAYKAQKERERRARLKQEKSK